MEIVWDEEKNLANQNKHGVSFEEAGDFFESDTDYLEIFDHDHSYGEDRFISMAPFVAESSWSSGLSGTSK